MKKSLKTFIIKHFFSLYILKQVSYLRKGYNSFNGKYLLNSHKKSETEDNKTINELRDFFLKKKEGKGIWKWNHYFDIYDSHLRKFKGKKINILEIGVYSGGSIEMWLSYFGAGSMVYGVDIEESCKYYEDDNVRIYIGDQQDREFWKRLKLECPLFDVVIDDGGHEAKQQIVTLEELLPHIKEGGVYICEDIHHSNNSCTFYINGLVHKLNEFDPIENIKNPDKRITSKAKSFQKVINSIHFYPFITVIEKNSTSVNEFSASKKGTKWQPFLK